MPRYSTDLLGPVRGDEFKADTDSIIQPLVETWKQERAETANTVLSMLQPNPEPVQSSVPTLASLGWEMPDVGDMASSAWETAKGAARSVADSMPSMAALGWGPDPNEQQAAAPSMAASRAPTPSGTPAAMPTGAPTGSFEIDRSSPTAFLGSFVAPATAALQSKGYPTSLAPILAAIPMNEQGYQREAPGNNYYGIKGSNPRTGASNVSGTWEEEGGQRVNQSAAFRAYDSPAESVADFLTFLETNPRYAKAVEIGRTTGDPVQFIKAVHAAGYATDSAWSDKILSIAARVPAAPPSQVAQRPQEQAQAASATGDLSTQYPRQDLVNRPDKWAICGPIAVVAAGAAQGKVIPLEQAIEKATAAGWTASSGMAGPQSQVATMQSFGIKASTGAIDLNAIKRDTDNGNVVILSSPGATGHYFVVQGVDAQGRLDLGNSALTLKASGGRRSFTLDELRNLGPIGAVDTAIYVDNPKTKAPSLGVALNAPEVYREPPNAGTGSSPLDDARASTGGGSLNMKAQQPVPMPGAVDEQATGGIPGLSPPEGVHPPGAYYPVDVREPGEMPYDEVDDEGADRTNDPLMAPPGRIVAPTPGERSDTAPGDSQMYRQPLGAQPELPTDAEYVDPDQGPREGGRQPFADAGNEAGPAIPAPNNLVMAPPEPAPPPNQVNRYVPSYAPQAAQVTAPEPAASPFKPLYDAGGQVVGYVQGAAEGIKGTAQSASDKVEEARGAISSTLADYGVGPAGMIPQRVLPRMDEIEAQAARETGFDANPNERLTKRAVRDPAWRARNPELADEYDQLERQFDLTVVGQTGDAGRIGRNSFEAVSNIVRQVGPGSEAASRVPGVAQGATRGGVNAAPTVTPQPRMAQAGEAVPKRATIPPARAQALAENVAAVHAEKQGSTINPSQGDMVGQPLYAVSIHPEQGIIIRGRDVTPADIATFLNENNGARRKILEADSRISIGTWLDEETGEHAIDLTATVSDRHLAENLGRAYNQKAVYGLADFEEIRTGGSGRVPNRQLPPLDQRLPLVGEADRMAREGLHAQSREVLAGGHPDWWEREYGSNAKALAQANRLEAGLERALQQTTDAQGLSSLDDVGLKPFATPTTKFPTDVIPRPTPIPELRTIIEAGLERGYGNWYREFADDTARSVGNTRAFEGLANFASYSAILGPRSAKKLMLSTMIAGDAHNGFAGMAVPQIIETVIGTYKRVVGTEKGLYYLPVSFQNVEGIYRKGSQQIGQPKLSNFWGDFFNGRLPWQADATPTNDVQMQRLEGYHSWGETQVKLGSDDNAYRYGSAVTRRVAQELGVPPEDAQAAGWVVQQLSSLPAANVEFAEARRLNLADPAKAAHWKAVEGEWKTLAAGVRNGSVTPGQALAEIQRLDLFDFHNPGSLQAINADPAVVKLQAEYDRLGLKDKPMPGGPRERPGTTVGAPALRGGLGHTPSALRPWMEADIRTRTQNPLNQRMLEQAPTVSVEGEMAPGSPFLRDLGIPNRTVDGGTSRGVAMPTMNAQRAASVGSQVADTLGQPVVLRRQVMPGETATHVQVTLDAANAPLLTRSIAQVRQLAEEAGAEVHWNGQQAHIYIDSADPVAVQQTLDAVYDGVQSHGINANAIRVGGIRAERLEPGGSGAAGAAGLPEASTGPIAPNAAWRSRADADIAQRLADVFRRDSGGAAPELRTGGIQPPSREVSSTPPQGIASRIRGAFSENAERTAAADARMAAEGSTVAPGVFGQVPEPARGRPTVEVLQDQLSTANQAFRRATEAGDQRMAQFARERAVEIESQLADARNARLRAEPAISSDVGQQVNPLTLTEESADDLTDVMRPREAVRSDPSELSGPVGIPTDMSGRMNATVGTVPGARSTDRLDTVNRVLAQGAASTVSGGTGALVNQEMNPDDPYAGIKGFAAGALAPALAARGGRMAARAAGKAVDAGGGALSTLGNVPGAAAQQAADVKPPNWLEKVQAIRYSWGMLGNPLATGLFNAVSGPTEISMGLPAAAIKTGLLEGRPLPVVYQAAELTKGLAEGVVNMLGTVVGIIPRAIRESPDFRPPMADRMEGRVGKPIGWVIDTPGRVSSQAPDALFTRAFDRWGRAQAISDMLNESGISRLRPDLQAAEIERLAKNPTSAEAERIDAGGRRVAREMGYRAEPGKIEKHVGRLFRPGERPATSNDPVTTQVADAAGSFLMPFFTALWQYNKRGLTYVPGLGSAIDTKVPFKDQVARQAVGAGLVIWAADYAARDGITGPGPSDPDEAAILRNKGIEPNSVLVPNVGYVPIDAFGPAAPILRGVAAYYDSQRYASDKERVDSNKMGERIVKDQLRAYSRFPVVQAMQAVYKMAESPIEGVTDFAASAASSFVPAPVRTKALAEDPRNRTTEKGVEPVERLRQKLVSRSGDLSWVGLGSRQELPAAQDRFGREIENPRQGTAALLPRVVQPKDDPLAEIFIAAKVEPGVPPKELAINTYGADKKVAQSLPMQLTDAEQREWNRIRGEALVGLTEPAQRDPNWASTPQDVQEKYLKKQLETANAYATRKIREAIPDDEVTRRIAPLRAQKAS